MGKIWGVIKGSYEHHVLCCFTTEKLAEAYLISIKENDPNAYVEEFELDPTDIPVAWHIEITMDMNGVSGFVSDRGFKEIGNAGFVRYVRETPESKPTAIVFSVETEDLEHALVVVHNAYVNIMQATVLSKQMGAKDIVQ